MYGYNTDITLGSIGAERRRQQSHSQARRKKSLEPWLFLLFSDMESIRN